MKIQYRTHNLTVFESALYRTTSTVFHNDDLILIVDPNWLPDEVNYIRQFVDAIRKQQTLYLLFTHSDYDHILGYGLFKDATVIASEAFQNNPAKAEVLQEIKQFDDKYYIARSYPIEYPAVDVVIDSDGQQLIIGQTRLSFQLAPGHNRDGLFTYIEPDNIWIVGDYLSNVEFPFIYHTTADYLQTLRKAIHHLRENNPTLLISGHGDVATTKKEMEERLELSVMYIEELWASVENEIPFELEDWLSRYDFPIGLREMHQANVELIRLEQNP